MALLLDPGAQFFDSNGAPAASGSLTFYDTGTTNERAVYSDPALSVEIANPYDLDSSGRIAVNVYGSGDYTVVLKDSTAATVWSRDDVFGWTGGEPNYARTAAEIAAGVTPTDYQYAPGDARRYGCVLDGSTDDSAAFQDAIDANKGMEVFIPEGELYCNGVTLNGATYDDTRVICNGGELKLKVRVGAGAPTIGLAVIDCSRITLDLKWNGNRANQPATEYVHCVALQGVTGCYIPRFECREIRGDGMYITQKETASESAQTTDVIIDTFYAYNSADDGRNALSIIAGDRISIGNFVSYQVGGVIDGANMPGGLDIEPNFGYQYCRDITIGTMTVVTAAAAGFSLVGKATTDDATRDWCIQRVTVQDSVIYKTGSYNPGPTLRRFSDLSWTGFFYREVAGNGPTIDYCDHAFLDLGIQNVTYGSFVGYEDWVEDFDIKLDIRDYTVSGLRAGGVRRGRFSGRVYGATSATNTYAIHAASNSLTREQVNVIYSVDCPYDGYNVRAFRVGTETFGAGTYAADCSWAGYTSASVQCDANIPTRNIFGRNTGQHTVQPANGNWVAGDRVENHDPDLGDPMGWIRLTTGTGATDRTDWAAFGQVGYRSNAGTPSSVLTPTMIGERVFDSTNSVWYTATGTANTAWKQDSA